MQELTSHGDSVIPLNAGTIMAKTNIQIAGAFKYSMPVTSNIAGRGAAPTLYPLSSKCEDVAVGPLVILLLFNLRSAS